MKTKWLLFIPLLIVWVPVSHGQVVSVFDGLELKVTDINSDEYVYGEPFKIYISVENTTGEYRNYWPPFSENVKIVLKDKSTGLEISRVVKEESSHPLFNLNQAPSNYFSFAPGQILYYPIDVSNLYGRNLLYENCSSANIIASSQRAISPGEYQIEMKYFIYPGEMKLTTEYNFIVRPTTAAENLALQAFSKANNYACSNVSRTGKSYEESHPDSYESFLNEFPNSIYADYARYFLGYVHSVPSKSLSKKENLSVAKPHLLEYVNNFPRIKRSGLKLAYSVYIPYFIQITHPENVKGKLNEVLLEIKDQHPEYSKSLINAAKQAKVTDLKNYAQERVEREQKE